jgi:hypothetical protein
MTDRNWDAEMAKIDRQLASISDDQLAANRGPSASSVPSAPAASPASTRTGRLDWGVAIRVSLAAALGAAVLFWPYAAACGLGLAGYFGAVASVVAAGCWAAVYSWRSRAPRAHAIALLVIVWGMSLGAREVLPRIGYAKDVREWVCR